MTPAQAVAQLKAGGVSQEQLTMAQDMSAHLAKKLDVLINDTIGVAQAGGLPNDAALGIVSSAISNRLCMVIALGGGDASMLFETMPEVIRNYEAEFAANDKRKSRRTVT